MPRLCYFAAQVACLHTRGAAIRAREGSDRKDRVISPHASHQHAGHYIANLRHCTCRLAAFFADAYSFPTTAALAVVTAAVCSILDTALLDISPSRCPAGGVASTTLGGCEDGCGLCTSGIVHIILDLPYAVPVHAQTLASKSARQVHHDDNTLLHNKSISTKCVQ